MNSTSNKKTKKALQEQKSKFDKEIDEIERKMSFNLENKSSSSTMKTKKKEDKDDNFDEELQKGKKRLIR